MLWVQVNDVNLVVQIAIVFKLKQVWKVWNTSACLISQTTVWHQSSTDDVYLQVIDLNCDKRCVLFARQEHSWF